MAQAVKNLPASAGDPGLIPGSGNTTWRSLTNLIMNVGSHYCAVNKIRTRAGIKEKGQPTANCVKSEFVLTWVVVVFSGSDVSNSL